jgi:hypothetical protein
MDQFKTGSEFIKIPILPSAFMNGASLVGNPTISDNLNKNELLISLNVNNIEHKFRFKNAVKDIESGMIKFVFTFNFETTVLYIEYENLTTFLIQLIDDKYYVDKSEMDEVFNDLIENLDFYLLGYNPLIKKFTFSNIVNLINKIGYIIINYSKSELNEFDKVKMRIQKRLYQLNNDSLEDDNKNKKNPGYINYNNNIETWENVFKKIWLLFNHLEKYDKNNSNVKLDYDNYFTLLDFIFDQNK